MVAVYPSAQNVFVRSHEASDNLVVDYARNINKFAVNRYCQIVPVKKVAGYYLNMTIEEAGRILQSDGANFIWPDSEPAPDGSGGTESHEYLPFRTTRRAFPFTLGAQTIEQASWDILSTHASIKARQAMTWRTQMAINALTTTGNYAASHVLDVTAISGATGNWAQSTSGRGDIKRSLFTAMETILDDTLEAVEPDSIQLVINSAMAAVLAQTQEIVDYIKGSPDAYAQVRGELPNRNKYYGIPERLWGFKVEVEATRKITTRKGATTVRTQILPTATPFMCSRPGALVGVEGSPNFSTCVLFAHEEMTVETKIDVDNRRTSGRIVDDNSAYVVAPASGVLFQAAA